jgi:hypothetical protein
MLLPDHTERQSHSSHTSRGSHNRRSGVSNPLFEEVARSVSNSFDETIPTDDGDIDPSSIRSLARENARKNQSGLLGCCFVMFMVAVLLISSHFAYHFDLFGDENDNNHHNNHDDDTLTVEETPSLFLVETIPLMNFSLSLTPGALNTYEALIGLCNNTRETLDISVMYWNLLVDENNDDVATNPVNCAELGCNRGKKMYAAFEDAAARGVKYVWPYIIYFYPAHIFQSAETNTITSLFIHPFTFRYRFLPSFIINICITHSKFKKMKDFDSYKTTPREL